MNNPDYNPEGRKLTYQQHMKMQREWEEKHAKKAEEPTKERSGICPRCGGSAFRLKAIKGLLERTCKNEECGDVKVF